MKKLMILAAVCLSGMAAQAQQNLSWGQGPQVCDTYHKAGKQVVVLLNKPQTQMNRLHR